MKHARAVYKIPTLRKGPTRGLFQGRESEDSSSLGANQESLNGMGWSRQRRPLCFSMLGPGRSPGEKS
jgi:hypothetical protein